MEISSRWYLLSGSTRRSKERFKSISFSVLPQSCGGISRNSLRIRYSELFIKSSSDCLPARSAVNLYTSPTSRDITRKQTNNNR
ncbi:Uncharacterised protein [Shigella sonnei]|nr:Uncharacterised protein [Shigella sonnei]